MMIVYWQQCTYPEPAGAVAAGVTVGHSFRMTTG